MADPLPPWAELRCPVTGAPLEAEDRALVTDGRRYPVLEGVPVLIDSAHSAFDPGDYGAGPEPGRSLAQRVRRRLIRVAAWQPPITKNVGSRENFEHMHALLSPSPGAPPARVLVVGGRQLGIGSEALLERPDVESVETDVRLGPRTQVICDAMRLPFADSTFDGAVAQAMLDCVPDPHQAVAELHRVLKPDGVIYSEVAFMQQQHDAAHDFWRFTAQGHRRLMRFFDEIDVGVQVGPGTALAWSVRAFARSIAGPRRILQVVLGRIAAALSVWMPLLDPYFVKHPPAIDAASGTYFLGRRREDAVPDRELLARYEGAQRDPYPSR